MPDYLITMDTGERFLAHHGTKGMKWGVWNDETAARYSGGTDKAAKKYNKGYAKYQMKKKKAQDAAYEYAKNPTQRNRNKANRAAAKEAEYNSQEYKDQHAINVTAATLGTLVGGPTIGGAAYAGVNSTKEAKARNKAIGDQREETQEVRRKEGQERLAKEQAKVKTELKVYDAKRKTSYADDPSKGSVIKSDKDLESKWHSEELASSYKDGVSSQLKTLSKKYQVDNPDHRQKVMEALLKDESYVNRERENYKHESDRRSDEYERSYMSGMNDAKKAWLLSKDQSDFDSFSKQHKHYGVPGMKWGEPPAKKSSGETLVRVLQNPHIAKLNKKVVKAGDKSMKAWENALASSSDLRNLYSTSDLMKNLYPRVYS